MIYFLPRNLEFWWPLDQDPSAKDALDGLLPQPQLQLARHAHLPQDPPKM